MGERVGKGERQVLSAGQRADASAGAGGTVARLLQSRTLWLVLSLAVATYYASMGLAEGWGDYVVQEDARQHVFWMQRFVDPSLFPNDLIADFFQSVAPLGFTWLYKTAISTGVAPFTVNKFLPPVILLATTVYAYFLALEIVPLAAMGGLAAILFNQVMWMTNDVASATPRAFVYLLLSAYFYYALRRSLWPYLATILLQSLFYPHTVLIGVAFSLTRLLAWDGHRLRWTDRRDARFYLLGIGMAIAVMLPYVFQTSVYGPTVTAAEARQMPEFSRGGRTPFFGDDNWEVWVEDSRVGIMPHAQSLPQVFQLVVVFPLLLCFPRLSPLIRQYRAKTVVLGQILLGSLGLFALAHLLLFRLHLPARYCEFIIRMVMALAVAFVLAVLLDAIARWSVGQTGRSRSRQAAGVGICSLLVAALVYVPTTVDSFIKTGYHQGPAPQLYEFFADRPADITIAALTTLADDIPSFAARTVLYSPEYAIPYQLGYYNQLRQRATDLLRSQYSPSLAEAIETIRRYDIDYWLLEPDSFSSNFFDRNRWWLHSLSPTFTDVRKQMESGEVPALADWVETCTVFQSQQAIVLEASCLADGFP